MTHAIDRLIYGALGVLLLGTYVGVVAVDAFRRARAAVLS